MKINLIGLILSFASFQLGAQNVNLTTEIVASAGESYTSNTLNVDWTLGEIMTETYDGVIILTQGFHQALLQTTSIGDPAASLGLIKLYPNPTTARLTIEREKMGVIQLTLLDIKGSILVQKQFTELSTELDLSQLTSGIYVLRMTGDQTEAHSVRIVKQ